VHRRRESEIVQARERKDESLASGKVDTRARLVQEQQRMLDEQRTGQQDPLALALGTGAERAVCETFASEGLQYLPSPHEIRLAGRCPPRRQDAAPAGQHDPERGRARREPVGDCVAHDPDARAELAEVARAETGTEHDRRPGGRMTLGTQQAQERGLACSVRAQHRPVLACADRERHRPEQTPAVRSRDGRAIEQRRESCAGLGVILRYPLALAIGGKSRAAGG